MSVSTSACEITLRSLALSEAPPVSLMMCFADKPPPLSNPIFSTGTSALRTTKSSLARHTSRASAATIPRAAHRSGNLLCCFRCLSDAPRLSPRIGAPQARPSPAPTARKSTSQPSSGSSWRAPLSAPCIYPLSLPSFLFSVISPSSRRDALRLRLPLFRVPSSGVPRSRAADFRDEPQRQRRPRPLRGSARKARPITIPSRFNHNPIVNNHDPIIITTPGWAPPTWTCLLCAAWTLRRPSRRRWARSRRSWRRAKCATWGCPRPPRSTSAGRTQSIRCTQWRWSGAGAHVYPQVPKG